MRTVTPEFITETFGHLRNGVRWRAFLRLKDGHLDPDSLRVGAAEIVGTGQPVQCLECTATPSAKDDDYCVRIVLDAQGSYCRHFSYCECTSGLWFCSNQLALWLLVYVFQSEPSWTFERAKLHLPEPVRSVQQLPIQVSYVYETLQEEEIVVKRELRRRKKEAGSLGSSAEMSELAREYPGYAAEGSGHSAEDDRVEEETAAEVGSGADLDVVALVDAELSAAKLRLAAGHFEGRGGSLVSAAVKTDNALAVAHPNTRDGWQRLQAEVLEREALLAREGKVRRGVLHDYLAVPGIQEARGSLLRDSGSDWAGAGPEKIPVLPVATEDR